jgi:hypothetical protein
MQTLLPQAPATASTRSTGLPLFFPFPFSFSFPLPFSFSLFFSLFFFFFLPIFYLFSFLPSFNIFGRPFRGREERNIDNNYHHSIDNYRNNFVNFQKFLTIG